MKVVVSLGGSVLPRDPAGLARVARVLEGLARRHTVRVVVGGGRPAREVIGAARVRGASDRLCDTLGIGVTRLNAHLLLSALRGAHPGVPESVWEAARCQGPLVVMGGTAPGHTTDGVAAMVAAAVGADLLVNATSVDGVYSEDPKTYPRARKFKRMTHRQLLALTGRALHRPGMSAVLDPLAARILARRRIPAVVVDGRNPRNIARAVAGESVGTRIG